MHFRHPRALQVVVLWALSLVPMLHTGCGSTGGDSLLDPGNGGDGSPGNDCSPSSDGAPPANGCSPSSDSSTTPAAPVCGDSSSSSSSPVADYPLFSSAAFFNRPISYWGVGVDSAATAVMQSFLTNDSRCQGRHPSVALGGYSIYWVHDGDSGLKEYSIQRRSSLWTCSMPGRTAISTFRIPSNAIWSYPSASGNRDHHLFVIDVSRNVVLSLYAFDPTQMGEVPSDTSRFMASYVNCDPLHGDDAAILASERTRWMAGPDWSLASQNGGVDGIGTGFGWEEGVTNAGSSVGGALVPQDFLVPGQDDLGHVLNCHVPPNLQNGKAWPATGDDGSTNDPSLLIRTGSLLRVDPNWTIPAGTPDWEARILRTWQRYGCMIDDNGSPDGCMSSRGSGLWEGPGGSNPWVGALPAAILGSSHVDIGLDLSHFPGDKVQVMRPVGPVYDLASQPVGVASRPAFSVSHVGRVAASAAHSGALPVVVTWVSGSSATITFGTQSAPAGVALSFSPPSCNLVASGSCATTVTVSVDQTVPEGTYEIGFTAAAAGSQTVPTTTRLVVGPTGCDHDG